ncbi:hypothetical protein AB0F81_44400, partial [Actinoplanes sp. NPDC024001]
MAYTTAATTAVAALVFLLPLGWGLRNDHRDAALADAARRSATVAGAIADSLHPEADHRRLGGQPFRGRRRDA